MPYKILLIVVILLLPHSPHAASVPVVWQGSNLYQTAVKTLVSTPAKSKTVFVPYAFSFSSTPKIVSGITQMVSSPINQIEFMFNVSTVNSSGFSLNYDIGAMSVSSMQVMYAAIHQSQNSRMSTSAWVQFSSLTSIDQIKGGSGLRNATLIQNYTAFTGQTFNTTNTNKILVWIQSIRMKNETGNFNINISSKVINMFNYSITVTLNGTTILQTLAFSRLIYDQTALQSTQQKFVDSGSAISTTNLAALSFTLPWKNNTNFFFGLTTFSFPGVGSFNFNFSSGLTCNGTMTINWLSFDYFNYRIRNCPAGYPYFQGSSSVCHDVCPPYFYVNLAINVCSACDYYCLTCTSPSSTACTSCDSVTDHRTLISGVCSCQTGFYDTYSLNPVCSACMHSCVTCMLGTTCSTCSAAHYRTLVSDQCSCNAGYVDIGAPICAACNATLVGCISCTDNTTCTACSTPNNFQIVGATCSCIAGYYLSGGTCLSCAASIPGCVSCSSSVTCTTCNAPAQFSLNGTICSCNSGYYLTGSTCMACTQVGCTSCASATNCTACNAANFFQLSASTCVCQPAHFLSGSTCVSCTMITGCVNCPASNVCTVCNTTNFFQLSGTSCVCQSGYYLSGGNCLTCPLGCTSCSSSALCSGCQPPLALNTSNLCSCSVGFYQSGTNCLACSSALTGCTSCASNTACLTCDAPANFQPDGLGLCLCKPGYFQSGATCSACMPGCLSCTAAATCTTCNATAHYIPSGAICVCDAAYVLSGGICVLCSTLMEGCAQCLSNSACTVCASDPYLSLSSGLCVCDNTYAWNTTSQKCEFCPTCCSFGEYPDLANGGCMPCSATYGADCFGCNENQCLNCVVGKYANGPACTACSDSIAGCTSCADSTTCNACDNSANFLLTGATCSCASGYGLNSVNLCVTCNSALPGCLVCSNLFSCTSCDLSNNFVSNPGNSSECICATGYFATGSTCTQCTALGCLECISPTTCTVCNTLSHFALSGPNCVCQNGYYLDSGSTCLTCGTAIIGCEACSDGNTCTQCDTAAHYELNAISPVCDCAAGYYFDGTVCQQCSLGCLSCDMANGCLACDPGLNLESDGAGGCRCLGGGMYLETNNVCTACTNKFEACQACTFSACTQCPGPVYSLVSGACQCGTNYFNNTSTCQLCSSNILGCVVCTATACSQCNATLHFTLSGTICVCEVGYANTGTQCESCSSLINGCEACSSAATCTSCNTTEHYTLVSGACNCASGYYTDASLGCRACSSAIPGCEVCADASTCTSCDSALNWQLSGAICVCMPNYTPYGNACSDCIATCSCSGYALDSNGACSPLCGDGLLLSPEQCDDGNTIAGDGCSPSCKVEENYTCMGGSAASASHCSYNKPLTIVLVDSWKDPTSNTIYFSFTISPAIAALETLTFSDYLSCTLPNTAFTSDYSDGHLLVELNYTSTIQFAQANLTFFPSASSTYFFATPDTVAPFTVDPNNNLAAVYYEDGVYGEVEMAEKAAYAVAGLGYAGFTAGMAVGRFISVEMIGVVQLAFVGLIVVEYLQPLLAAMTKIGFVNGVNSLFSDQRQALLVNGDLTANAAPKTALALSYDAQMVYSLNYSILLLLLPPLTALILFIASKICKTKEKMERFERWSLIALCDFGLSAVVFLTYHILVSLLIWAIYSKSQGSLFPFSIADAVFSMSVAIVLMVLFKMKPQHFGDFKTAFKPDKLSQSHYYLLIGSRIILSILLVGTNSTKVSGFLCAIVPLLSIIYLGIRRPYSHNYNNFRAIFNSSAEFLILAIYGYYRCFVTYDSSFTGINAFLPYVVIALLAVTIIVNIAAIVKFSLDKCKKKKQAKQLKESLFKTEQEQNKLFLAGMMKQLTKFTQQKKGPQVRQLLSGKRFSPEKIEMDRGEKQYSSQLSVKSINQQLIKQKKVVATQRKLQEKVFTKEEMQQVENDFDAI